MMGLRPVNIDGPELKAAGIHLLYDVHVLHRVLLLLGQGIAAPLIIRHIVSQALLSLAHQLVTERRRADTEVSRIISQRIVDLTVGNSPGHHYVGRRVGLREHVLNQGTGLDIPVLHSRRLHGLDPFRFQTLALSHALHDGKGKARLHAHLNQVEHDIVTGTDGSGNCRLALFNEALGIIQPHVRTMGQTGNSNQV